MAQIDRPTQQRHQPHATPPIHSHEDFPPLPSLPVRTPNFPMPTTAQDLATMVASATPWAPKPTLLGLPSEILGQIAYHAIPEEASVLDPATLSPKASTLNLQLVCKTFRASVLEQYYRRLPLQIHLFNPKLQSLLTRDPSRYGDSHPDFIDIDRAMRHHAKKSQFRMSNFKQIPLHRFRKVEVHLIPQLSNLNLSDDKLEAFFYQEANIRFRRSPRVDEDEEHQGDAGDNDHAHDHGSTGYNRLLHIMKHSLLDDAYAVSKHLAKHLWNHAGVNRNGRGQTQIKVLCHESADDLPEYDLGQYQLNSLPGPWGTYLPRSLKNAFDGPRMPIWELEEIWELLRIITGSFASGLSPAGRTTLMLRQFSLIPHRASASGVESGQAWL